MNKKFRFFLLLIIYFSVLNPLSAASFDQLLKNFKHDLEANNLLLRHEVENIRKIKDEEERRLNLKQFLDYTQARLPTMRVSSSSKNMIEDYISRLNISLNADKANVLLKAEQKDITRPKVQIRPETIELRNQPEVVNTLPVSIPEKAAAIEKKSIPAQPARAKAPDILSSFSLIPFIAAIFGLPLIALYFRARRSPLPSSNLNIEASEPPPIPVLKQNMKDHKSTPQKVSLPVYFETKFQALDLADQPYFLTTNSGKVAWSNRKAKDLLKISVGAQLNNEFDSIENIGNDLFELSQPGRLIKAKTSPVQTKNGSTLSLYSCEIQSGEQVSVGPFHFTDHADQIALKNIVEQTLQKKSYLFQIIGMSVSFHFDSKASYTQYETTIASVIENTLLAMYLMVKDSTKATNKHISVNCSQNSQTGRNYITFSLKGHCIQESDLLSVRVFPNKIEDSIANIFKRNELSLAALKGRFIISNSKDEMNSDYAQIEISFNDEREALSFQTKNEGRALGTTVFN